MTSRTGGAVTGHGLRPVRSRSSACSPAGARCFEAACRVVALLFASTVASADWPVASPAEVGLQPAPLEALAERIGGDPAINTHSVLVARHGKLVFERYFEGRDQDWGKDLGVVRFDADTRHDLRSVSKSVTSALVGIALAEGKIPGPEADVFELFPTYREHLAPDKHGLKLQHILSMTAGLDWFEPPDNTHPIRLID